MSCLVCTVNCSNKHGYRKKNVSHNRSEISILDELFSKSVSYTVYDNRESYWKCSYQFFKDSLGKSKSCLILTPFNESEFLTLYYQV